MGESMQGDCVNKGDMWTGSWRRPTYKDQHKKEEMEIQGEKQTREVALANCGPGNDEGWGKSSRSAEESLS